MEDKFLINDEKRDRILSLMPDKPETAPAGPQAAPPMDDAKRTRILSLLAQQRSNTISLPVGDQRMAMFPDDYTDKDNDRDSVFERGYKSFASGFMSIAPGSMVQMGGLLDTIGFDDTGMSLTEKGVEWSKWIQDNVAVEDPTLANQVVSGFGSLASFLLVGLAGGGAASGVSGGLRLAGTTASIFQKVFQVGAMSAVESAVEQSQRMEELIGQGQSPEEALKNSEKIFWQNMLLTSATNAAFFSPASRFAKKMVPALSGKTATRAAAAVAKVGATKGGRFVEGAFSEGLQERTQGVIQSVASGRGTWADLTDPNKHRTETIVGFLTGGTAGAVFGAIEQKGDKKKKDGDPDTPDDAGGFETDAPEGFSTTAPSEAAAVEAGAMQDEQKMEALQAGGASEAELELAENMILLERSLESDYGVQGIDLGQLLTEDEIREIGALAAEARNEPDAMKSISMEHEVSERLKNILLRTANRHNNAKRALSEKEQEEAIDAEADILIDQSRIADEAAREDRDLALTEDTAALEAGINQPDLNALGLLKPAKGSQLTQPQKPKAKGKTPADFKAEKGVAKAERVVARTAPDLLAPATRKPVEAEPKEEVASVPPLDEAREKAQKELDEIEDRFQEIYQEFDAVGVTEEKKKALEAEEAALQERGDALVDFVDGDTDAPPVAKVEPTPTPIETIKAKAKEKAAEKKPQPKPAPKQEAKPTKGGHILPLPAINTEPETFQMRDEDATGIDEEFVADAVDNFDENKVNEITVWKDPKDGKFKVLDGHHTLEILKRVGKKTAKVKIFKGTKKAAVELSEELNAARREVNAFDAVKVLRKLRDSGASKKELAAKAKKVGKKNAKDYLKMSYLNIKGKVMKALKATQNSPDSYAQAEKFARWIGAARQKWPTLTNQHEDEMWNYLEEFAERKKITNENDFLDIIADRGMLGDFTGSQSLNLKKAGVTVGNQASFDKQVKALTAQINTIKAQRSVERKTYADRRKSSVDKAETANINKALTRIEARYAEQIDALTADRDRLKVEWRKAQDAGVDQSIMFDKDLSELSEEEWRERLKKSEKIGKLHRKYQKEAAAGMGQQQKTSDADMVNLALESTGVAGKVVHPVDSASKMLVDIAKRFGARIVFFSHPGTKTSTTSGFFAVGDINRVFINVNSKKPLLWVLGHEIGHYMEGHRKSEWNKIFEATLGKRDALKFKEYQDSKVRNGYGDELTIEAEFVSDLIAEQFTKPEFWNYLKSTNPSMFADLINKVKAILNTVKALLKGRGQMGQYLKNYAGVELAIRDSMKKISKSEQKTMGIESDPAQVDLFKDAPVEQGFLFSIEDKGMADVVNESERTRKAVDKIHRRIRSGTDLFRLIYQRMVDKDSFLFKATKHVIRAAGLDYQGYDVTKNPYHAIRLMSNWATRAQQSLTDVVLSWDGTKSLSPGLQRIFKKFNLAKWVESGEFGQYAQFMRMEAIYKKDGNKYFTGDPEDIGVFDDTFLSDEQLEAKADFDAKMEILKRYRKAHPKWDAAVKEVTKWNHAILERAKQAGLLTEDDFSNMTTKYNIFVPMRVLEKETGLDKKIGYELGAYKAGVVRMDAIDSMIKNAYRMEFLSNINVVKVAARNLVKDLSGGRTSLKDFGQLVFPSTDHLQEYIDLVAAQQGVNWKKADKETKKAIRAAAEVYAVGEFQKEGVVAMKVDGEMEYWQFEPDIMDALTSQGGKESHFWLKFFSAQTQLLRAGAILTPEFMQKNQFRDFVGSMILSKRLVNNPVDLMMVPVRIYNGLRQAIAHASGKPVPNFQQYINSGGGNATMLSPDLEGYRKAAKDIAKNPSWYRHKNPVTILQNLTNIIEHSTRLAVNEKTYNDLIKKDYSHEQASAIAAMEGRESSTDFSRAGEYGAVLNRIIPFFNAGIQGVDKLNRSLFTDKGRRTKTWTKGILLLTVPTIMLWEKNHDEEWYKELPLYIKNHFWCFSFDGGKTIHFLPKPFEIGAIFASLPERLLDWFYDKDPKAVESWLSGTAKDIIPMSPLSLLGPTLASVVEANINYSVYQGSPIVKGYKEDIIPREQYSPRTSEFAKVLGAAAPGKGVSPMMIDHVIRGSFGGLGKWGAEIASNIIMEAKPSLRDKRPASKEVYGLAKDWYPIVKSVTAVGPPAYTRNMKDFFDAYDNARDMYNTFTAFKSGGATRKQFADLYLTDGKALEQYRVLQGGMKAASEISKKMAMVQTADPDKFNREEKRAKLDELQAQRNNVFKRVMDKYNSVDWGAVQDKMDKKFNQVMSDWDRANGGK